jgi:D-alanine-D-alanine ligase
VERPDIVFIALHGPGGEDGTVQGFLEVLNIPYTGSGVLASALAMDKVKCKALLSTENIWMPADVVFHRDDAPRLRRASAEVERQLGFPVIVKPSRQGSTYGCTVVDEAAGLNEALRFAFRYDDTALVEQRIDRDRDHRGRARERQPSPLPVVEIVPPNASSIIRRNTPKAAPKRSSRPDTEAAAEEATEIALRCHRLLGCRGMSRTDMFVTDDGVVTLEVNTIPGMTPTSLLPKAARPPGSPSPHFGRPDRARPGEKPVKYSDLRRIAFPGARGVTKGRRRRMAGRGSRGPNGRRRGGRPVGRSRPAAAERPPARIRDAARQQQRRAAAPAANR